MKYAASLIFTRFNVVFAGIVATYGLVISALAAYYDTGMTVTSNLYSIPLRVSVMVFLSFLVFIRPLFVIAGKRPLRPLRAIADDYREIFLNSRRLLTALPVLVLMPVFFSLFTSAKNMLPAIHPFDMDPVLASIDRAVHFGRHPWEWILPAVGFAVVTSAISFTYKTWFFAKFIVCIWQAFSLKLPKLREQFFITFVLSWIINGTFLAVLLSSAGPCFFGEIYPRTDNPYTGLMAYLRETNSTYPVFDFYAMDYLWKAYMERKTVIFSSISAMPSMHVAVAFLFALLGWRVNRLLGWFFTVYLVLIMIGSVHIGWHYAIDGYVAILVTWALWLLVGRWTGRDEERA